MLTRIFWQDQRDGSTLQSGEVRNAQGKLIALFARDFCRVVARRYFRDFDLCRKLARLTWSTPSYRDKTCPLTLAKAYGYQQIEPGKNPVIPWLDSPK